MTIDLKNYVFEGSDLPISKFPAPVLLQKAKPVTEFNNELHVLIKNMLYTMYRAPGIGLAAPQIGKSIRMFVIDVDYDREETTTPEGNLEKVFSNFNPRVFINPEIVSAEGTQLYEEGCLSVPGVYEEVERSAKIILKYQDEFGEPKQLEAEGVLAVCIQHENDHLNGIVFLDRLSLIKRNILKKKFTKKKKT